MQFIAKDIMIKITRGINDHDFHLPLNFGQPVELSDHIMAYQICLLQRPKTGMSGMSRLPL